MTADMTKMTADMPKKPRTLKKNLVPDPPMTYQKFHSEDNDQMTYNTGKSFSTRSTGKKEKPHHLTV